MGGLSTRLNELKTIQVYCQNVGGIRTKLNDFSAAVACSHYDIIVLIESWLNEDYSDIELNLPTYNIYRHDRNINTSNKERGGGILIAVSKSLISSYLTMDILDVEQLFVLCNYNKKQFIIGGVYLPPNSPEAVYSNHMLTVEFMRYQYSNVDFFIFGDYNLPDFYQLAPDGSPKLNVLNPSANVVAQGFAFLDFYQFNTIPNSRGVYLDLAFTSISDLNMSLALDALFPGSVHHEAYAFEIAFDFGQHNKLALREFYYDFSNADYAGLNNYLGPINWSRILDPNDIDQATETFYNVLNNAIPLFVPRKQFKTSHFPKWFTSELRNLVILKKIAHKKFKSTGNINYYNEFAYYRQHCKALSTVCYQNYIQSVDTNLRVDPRSFWKFVNNKNNVYSLPSGMHWDNRFASEAGDVAQLFSGYFGTIYSNGTTGLNVVQHAHPSNTHIQCPNISTSAVFDKIASLPNRLSLGPDGIPNIFLKRCIYSLSQPLNLLFNYSLDLGKFPDAWKVSFVVPVYKSGDRSNVKNYRGVSNQSAIPKMFDSLIYDKLYFNCKQLLNECQHGFVRNRSTVTNLMIYETEVLRALESRLQLDSIYTDFSKAFDTVNHRVLLGKLGEFGFSDDLVKWFSSFLIGRRQRVKIGSFVSEDVMVSSGVPQGSHCAPLLFNIFINDIGSCFINSKYLLFADDLKFFRPVSTSSDCELLQSDLNNLYLWCCENELSLNVAKCGYINFYRSYRKFNSSYHINEEPIQRFSSVKDLGVICDEQLTFVEHYNRVSVKSSKVLGYIIRNCQDLSINSIKTVYKALVVPHIDYASVVWSPFYQSHIITLERVQNRFLRFCAFKLHIRIEDHDYDNVRDILNLPTLESRRTFNGIIFIFKIINSIIDCPYLLESIGFNTPVRRLRNPELFHIDFHSRNYAQCSPINKALKALNSLDLDVFGSTLASFKRQLRNVILAN